MTAPDTPDSSGDSPGSVLARALRLRDQLQYSGVVELCDPGSLTEWFRQYCEVKRPPTKADLRRQLPHLHDDELERVITARLARWGPRDMPGTTSYAELVALTPEEFALRWFENEDIRCSILRRLRLRGRPAPEWTLGEVPFTMGSPERIAESDVRVTYWHAPTQDPEVNTMPLEYEELRRGATGEWRLIARRGLLQSRVSTIVEMPQEYADLFGDDAR